MQKTKSSPSVPSQFIQTLSMASIMEQCMRNYKEKGDDNTISTTGVPFTQIGTIGIYSVSVRYSRLFNREPSWGFSLSCGGMHNDSGYKTCAEAISACIAVYNQKEKMVGKLMVIGGDKKYNFSKELQPLFDAMTEGKTIKSITCMGGSMNKDDREKDWVIENFIANEYYVGFSCKENDYFDYVDTNKGTFYMNWVLSFVIE